MVKLGKVLTVLLLCFFILILLLQGSSSATDLDLYGAAYLPDYLAGKILDYEMVPHLKKNGFGEGLLNGAIAISQVIAKHPNVNLTSESTIMKGQPKKPRIGFPHTSAKIQVDGKIYLKAMEPYLWKDERAHPLVKIRLGCGDWVGIACLIPNTINPPLSKTKKEIVAKRKINRNIAANVVMPYNRVNDYSDKLTDSEEDNLNRRIIIFEKETTIQIAVLIIPTIKPYFDDHREFATRTFNRWGIGQKYKNNGLFFTVATEDRRVRLTTGYGMECVFTDELCGKILDEDVVPQLRNGNYYKAISQSLDKIIVISRNNMSRLQKEWDFRLGKHK